jgi:acyl-CoA thioester hydrolase
MQTYEDRRRMLEAYPHTVSIQTRFADVDPQMHINSIRLAEIFEEARLRFVAAVGYEFRPGAGRMLATAINHVYLGEVRYPGSVDVANAFIDVDSNRWVIGQAAFQADRCVALCDITVTGGRKGALPFADEAQGLLAKYGLRSSHDDRAELKSDQPR